MTSDRERGERALAELLALIDASATLTASEVESLHYRGGDGLRVVFDLQPATGGTGDPAPSVRLDREERPRRTRRPRALDGRRGADRRALEGPP